MKRALLSALPLILIFSLGVSLMLAQDDVQAPEGAEQVERPVPKQLTPLAIGNTWVYENKADGVISTERIEGMVLFDNHPWYLLRTNERPIEPEPDQDEEAELLTELWLTRLDGTDADALVELDDQTFTLGLSNISKTYRYPVTQGETYQPDPDNPGIKVEVVEVGKEVKTKAGSFKCIVYRQTIEDEEGYAFTAYAAPGVGIVQYTTEQGGESATAELIKLTLVEQNR